MFAQNSASRSYNSAQKPVHHHVVQTVPSPQEARIWFKQAKGDISVASKMMLDEQQEFAYNWVCFLCYQATEKALKALHYNRDANNTDILRTRNLLNLVRYFDGEVQTHVTQLTTLLGQQESMMYPSRSNYPMTPLDLYTKPMAEHALQLTTDIVEFVHKALYN